MSNQRPNRRYPLDWITLYNVAVNRRMYYAQKVDEAKRDWAVGTRQHNYSPPTLRTGRTPDEIFNQLTPNGLLIDDYKNGIGAAQKNTKLLNYMGNGKKMSSRVTVMKRYKMSQRPQAMGRLALAPIRPKLVPTRRDASTQNGGDVIQNGGPPPGDWQHHVIPIKHEIIKEADEGQGQDEQKDLVVQNFSRNVTEYESIESIYKRNKMKLPAVLKPIKGRPQQSHVLYQKQGPEHDELPALGYS